MVWWNHVKVEFLIRDHSTLAYTQLGSTGRPQSCFNYG